MAWNSIVPARGTPALVSCLCRFSFFHHSFRCATNSSSSALTGRTTAVKHTCTVVLFVNEAPLSESRFPAHAPPLPASLPFSCCTAFVDEMAREGVNKDRQSNVPSREEQVGSSRFAITWAVLRRRIDKRARAGQLVVYVQLCCYCPYCLGG